MWDKLLTLPRTSARGTPIHTWRGKQRILNCNGKMSSYGTSEGGTIYQITVTETSLAKSFLKSNCDTMLKHPTQKLLAMSGEVRKAHILTLGDIIVYITVLPIWEKL